MIFSEKKLALRNGETAVLRSPERADAAEMLEYIKKACGETDFLLRNPEEWDDVTVEKEADWVEQLRNAPNRVAMTCFVGRKAIGNCELAFFTGKKTAHRATIAIAIHRDYWNMGIGSAMLEEMIREAEKHGIEIMELEFIEGNDRARHLYEKFGFRVIAEKPNAFKLKNGTYCSEFHMQKRMAE